MFVTIEGGDGAGKTTLARLLHQELTARGHDVLLVREPGGTELGETLRLLLLDPTSRIHPRAEALLYATARAALVAEVIRPALEAGRTVVADRFVDSSLAYQGEGRGLGVETVRAANELAVGGLRPDLVLVLDVAPDLAAARRGGVPDRLEGSPEEFHARVRAGFLALARAEPDRFVVIDAAQPAEQVAKLALEAIEGRLQ